MSLDLTHAPATSPDSIYRYRDGLYAVDLLTTALVELDLFTWLAGTPSTFGQICDHFRLQRRPADVMMTLFTARGYVQREGQTYHVTDTAREHLVASSPWCLTPYYASLRERPIVRDFLEVLRTGKPANWGGSKDGQDWHAAMETDAFARRFTAAMDCRGTYLGQALSRALDLRACRRLLDIGGGSGIYACALVAGHPHLSATVLDQKPVDAIAATLIAERGFSGQVAVAAANFLSEPLPTDHDVHLFSNVLHDWDEGDARRLLSASFVALPPGGLLVIHDAFINASKTGPIPVAEYSALLMHSTQGKCYATSEYEQMAGDAGFGDFTFAETAADRGCMTARKPA